MINPVIAFDEEEAEEDENVGSLNHSLVQGNLTVLLSE